ncbi:probable alpha-aspartyl dipeptidase isoform X3 [Hermetia illucens]|uniref:probable alpha-aspartyl dipeptidase isoform X3 n=1 Tax=Hermetia illucens TaxID=343691 RepID=UPI0018CC7A99|nr:probable alpha-aspartyl dipeptidase isoform X3 [Hermetia illucens]
MPKRQILLLTSSLYEDGTHLEHVRPYIEKILTKNNAKHVLFIPYALASGDHDGYTKKVETILGKWGFQVDGIHKSPDQIASIKKAQAIFIGGGNTFLLLKHLYDKKLVEAIRSRIIDDGIPYIGSSAGTNVAARSIQTTNDMPIICPGSFDALKLVPFHINPHYLDPDTNSTHRGETREERILEFLMVNERPCLALREGTCLIIEGKDATLVGPANAILFRKGKEPTEFPPGTNFGFLFDECKD